MFSGNARCARSSSSLQSPRVSPRLGERPRRESSASGGSGAGFAYAATMAMNLKKRSAWVVWATEMLDSPEVSPCSGAFVKAMSVISILGVLMTFILAFEPGPVDGVTGSAIEATFEILFALELLFRYIVCPSTCIFFRNIYNVMDMFSAAPIIIRLYVGFRMPTSNETILYFLLLCLVPSLRLLRLLRHFEQFHLLMSAFSVAFEALPVLIFTGLGMALTFAAFIYAVEPRSNIANFPDAVWLAIVTMTTVGYGDSVAKSQLGRLVTGLLIGISVLYMAMPIGIVGDAFSTVWKDRDRLLLMHRTRLRLISGGYTVNDLYELFELFDRKNEGALGTKEFAMMIDSMHIGITKERVLDLFNTFDLDGGGTITCDEFVKVLFPHAYFDMEAGEKDTSGNGLLGLSRSLSSKALRKLNVGVFRGRDTNPMNEFSS